MNAFVGCFLVRTTGMSTCTLYIVGVEPTPPPPGLQGQQPNKQQTRSGFVLSAASFPLYVCVCPELVLAKKRSFFFLKNGVWGALQKKEERVKALFAPPPPILTDSIDDGDGEGE